MPFSNVDLLGIERSTRPAADSEAAQSPEKFDAEIDCERIAKYIDISNDLQQAIVKLIA